MSILTENWHTRYTGGVDFKSRLRFSKFDSKIHLWANLGPKIQSCPFCLKIGAHSVSRMLILNPDLDFWNFDPRIHFWPNLGPKSQRCPFCLKIGTHDISSMLIFIPTLVFWISNPNVLFGQIWAKKVNIVRFNWKLAHIVSWTRRCRIRTYFLKFWPQNLFFGKIGQKKAELFALPENWYTCYLEVSDSCSNISFLNFKT